MYVYTHMLKMKGLSLILLSCLLWCYLVFSLP